MADEHDQRRTENATKKKTSQKNWTKLNWETDIIAFALFDLKCPTLDYVYDMSYAEFQIRAFAYNRTKDYEIKLYRKQLYTNLIAPYQDPKHIPKTEELFMPLGEVADKNVIGKEVRDRFQQKMDEYNRKKNA